jgi:hypothetical protein
MRGESRRDAHDLSLIRDMALEIVDEATTKERRELCQARLIAACERYSARHGMNVSRLYWTALKKAEETNQ